MSGISSIPGIGCPVVINSTICAKEVGYAGSAGAGAGAVAVAVVPVPGSNDDSADADSDGCASPVVVFESDPDSCCVALALAVGSNQALYAAKLIGGENFSFLQEQKVSKQIPI